MFHLDFIGLLPRTLLGIYFGILVWRSGSILPAMLAHGANNLLAFALVPYADSTAPGPTMTQALLLAAGTGAVFVAMLVAYLRLTRASAEGPPESQDLPAASASEASAPTDTSTPPDSSHRTDPHEW